MSEHEPTSTMSPDALTGAGEVVDLPRTRERTRRRPRLWRRRKRPKRFKVRKLRVLLVLFFLGVLGIVSALFGMFMAVASDLPHLQRPTHTPTTIEDRRGDQIGTLTGSERRIYLSETQIAPVMKHAIISIEDRRFYTNSGVDLRGIARAAVEDVTSGQALQGASTIPQQFVKLSLAAENERTIFQKLREAALAYHLTRRWSKEEILRNYLNQIYFGNGAYGIESAARTYFSYNHDRCGGRGEDETPCASVLQPHEAALLAAMVASPSAFDPIQHPVASKRRRDLVLLRMLQQGYLTRSLYDSEKAEDLPTGDDLNFPKEDTDFPYFTSWIKPQVVDQLGGGQQGAQRAFEGGLVVQTTIDSRVQRAAEKAIKDWLPPGRTGPRASLVAIANNTGEVRAMVGGDNYGTTPFNLATQGQRQPGSSFKPFVLAEALRQGISPQSTWESKKKTYILKGGEKFTVNNYEDAYGGIRTLANATTFSDNAVYAQVGMKVKTKKVAKLARRMGVRTSVSSNYAMALGGLRTGVTPLDMAHAYETFATGGKLVYGTLSPGQSHKSLPVPGPVGHRAHRQARRQEEARGRARRRPEDDQQAQGAQGAHAAGGRHRLLDPADRRQGRHRDPRPDPRRDDRRQDRHHRGLRRRVVRGLDEGVHRRRLGRLPRRVQADEDRVPRQAGLRWHLSRRDLEDLHAGAAEDRPAAQEGRRRRNRQAHRDADAGHGHLRPAGGNRRPARRDDGTADHRRRRDGWNDDAPGHAADDDRSARAGPAGGRSTGDGSAGHRPRNRRCGR